MAAAIETSVVWGGDVVTVPLAHPFTVTETRAMEKPTRRRITKVRLMPPSLAVLEAIRSGETVGPATLIAACSDLTYDDARRLLWPDSETILAALGPLIPPDFLVRPPAPISSLDGSSPDPADSDAMEIALGDVETGDPGEIFDFFAED